MKTANTSLIKPIILESLKNAISYDDYRKLVIDLVANKSTSGNEKTKELIEFTKLNDRRMKRWDKTIKLSDAIIKKIKDYKTEITWLVITESWCGDAAHIIPVINKAAEQNPNIDLKIVLRDDNETLMDNFLTNGGKAIPKLIMLNTNAKTVVNTFGPRPTVATKMVNAYKTEHGSLSTEFKEDLQRWYNKDKGQSILEDLLGLLN